MRPDGAIQYAENPPKKYQDIYPLDFESAEWRALWEELKSVFDFWIAQGVLIFRVDNPHTKPFSFWEWVIGTIKEQHPETVFLAEAFTRPHVMNRLAKAGFSQSYTYFTWRNTKQELTDYFSELDANRSTRVPPSKSLAQHTGHPSGISPDRRTAGIHGAAHSGSYTRGQLWNLWSRIRAMRKRTACSPEAKSTWILRNMNSKAVTSTMRQA